jgi:hypothetical protein
MKRRFTNEEAVLHFKGLAYGRPGVGKTYSALSIPNLQAIVVISAEAGLLPLRKTRIEVWEIENWKDVNDSIEFLKSEKLIEDRKNRKLPPLETVFIDSATELTKKAIEWVLQERDAVIEARGKDLKTIFEDQMTLEDWGVAKGRIDRMFRAFRDLPYNIIFTALEHSMQSEVTKTIKKMPFMYPQSLSEVVPGYFDEVFYMQQMEKEENNEKKIYRWWETVDDGNFVAKDRLGVLKRQIIPDWSQVFKAMKGDTK